MKFEFYRTRLISWILIVVLIVACAQLSRHYRVGGSIRWIGATWTVPYLSGAVNVNLSGKWLISASEVEKFLTLKDKWDYRFSSEEDLVEYKYNNIGLVYIIYLAKKIFFLSSDLDALINFQIFSHICIVLILGRLFSSNGQKILFLCLYGINPVVLYFVTMPFYYFWQVIPSVLVLFLLNGGIKKVSS